MFTKKFAARLGAAVVVAVALVGAAVAQEAPGAVFADHSLCC